MSLKNLKATLEKLSGSFLEKNIEVLKDLIDLYNQGTDAKQLVQKLKEKNTFDKKQIKFLVETAIRFAKDPKELQYLFTGRAVTDKGKLSPSSISHFLQEIEQGFMLFEGKNLSQQRESLQVVNNSVKKLKGVIDAVYESVRKGIGV